MIKAISTYVYIRERLHPGMLDGLKNAGAEAIEVFGARNHFDYSDRQHVKEIAAWFKANDIPMNSLHAPMFPDYEWGRTGTPPVNIVDPEKRRRVESMDEIKRALEAAEQVPFRFLVQHLGTPNETFDPQKFEYGLSSLEHLHAFARPLGVKILLENIPNEIATPEKLIEFLDVLHYDDMGIIFDVGHANVMSSIPQAFDIVKTRIRSTHIHDNNMDRDAHLWPGKGSINWPETLALLRTAPHVPPLVLEINGENQENILGKYEEAFQLLEQAANTPAE